MYYHKLSHSPLSLSSISPSLPPSLSYLPTVFLCDIFHVSTPSWRSTLPSDVRLRSLYFSAIWCVDLSIGEESSFDWYSWSFCLFSVCLTTLLTYWSMLRTQLRARPNLSDSSLSSAIEREKERDEKGRMKRLCAMIIPEFRKGVKLAPPTRLHPFNKILW